MISYFQNWLRERDGRRAELVVNTPQISHSCMMSQFQPTHNHNLHNGKLTSDVHTGQSSAEIFGADEGRLHPGYQTNYRFSDVPLYCERIEHTGRSSRNPGFALFFLCSLLLEYG